MDVIPVADMNGNVHLLIPVEKEPFLVADIRAALSKKLNIPASLLLITPLTPNDPAGGDGEDFLDGAASLDEYRVASGPEAESAVELSYGVAGLEQRLVDELASAENAAAKARLWVDRLDDGFGRVDCADYERFGDVVAGARDCCSALIGDSQTTEQEKDVLRAFSDFLHSVGTDHQGLSPGDIYKPLWRLFAFLWDRAATPKPQGTWCGIGEPRGTWSGIGEPGPDLGDLGPEAVFFPSFTTARCLALADTAQHLRCHIRKLDNLAAIWSHLPRRHRVQQFRAPASRAAIHLEQSVALRDSLAAGKGGTCADEGGACGAVTGDV